MNFWALLVVAAVIAIGVVVVVIVGSDTGKDDEEGYSVADDPADAHYNIHTDKME